MGTIRIALFIILVGLISCFPKRNERDVSKVLIGDSRYNDTITIFTEDSIRYIYPGNVDYKHNDGYIKLDISGRPRFGGGEVTDEIKVCFYVNGYKWKACMPYAGILEDKLDSSLYYFAKSEEIKDSRGAITLASYVGSYCSGYSINENTTFPSNGFGFILYPD